MVNIFTLFMGLGGRYNFTNMSRYGDYSEQMYRNNFEKPFDFLAFNKSLILENCSPHRVIAFDPSYIPKSRKKTEHMGTFWSGTSGKALKGLEIGGFAVVERKDANLHYLYQGKPTGKKGRPKMKDGKISMKNIDKRRL